MNYSFEVQDKILITKLHGKRATVEFSGELKKEMLEKIEEGYQNVVVDLSEIEFVDSSFLGAMVAGLKKATMKNGDLKIVGLQSPVRAMFELTRLYRIFDIFDDLEEALSSF